MRNMFSAAMRFTPVRFAAAAVLSLALAGCLFRESPVASWYVFPSSPAETSGQSSALQGPRIAVGPLTLPAYLDRSNVFIRQDAASPAARIAPAALWGEPLEEGVARVLCESMGAALASRQAVVFPLELALPADWRVFIHVVRFDGAPNAPVALKASWSFVSATGEVRRTGQFSDTVTAAGGVDGLVLAQDTLLRRFGKTLAEAAPLTPQETKPARAK